MTQEQEEEMAARKRDGCTTKLWYIQLEEKSELPIIFSNCEKVSYEKDAEQLFLFSIKDTTAGNELKLN